MSYINYDLVVRNTVMFGGAHAKANMRQILTSWLQRQSIYAPSPMRLLRLANGKRCENRNCDRKTNNTRLGLYLCAACANDLTTHRSWREQQQQQQRCCQDSFETIMNDDRIDKTWGTMVLREPFHDSAKGEIAIGPRVTYADMETMLNNGTSLNEFLLLQQHDNKQRPDYFPDQELSQRLWQIYNQADRDKQEIWSQWIDRREDKEKAKVDKIIDAITKVKSMLKGSAKDYAMEYTVSTDGTNCSLSFGMTHELMRAIVHAPSKITKKKLREIAANIDAAYPLVFAHGMHDFTCLSWNDPLQKAIRVYLEQPSSKYEPGLAFLRDRSFVGAIASLEKHKDAISPVLKRVFSWTYHGVVPNGLRQIIAKLIVEQRQSAAAGGCCAADLQLAQSISAGLHHQSTAVTTTTTTSNNYLSLSSSSSESSLSSEWTLCQRLYEVALHEYTLLRPAIAMYLCDARTQAFVSNRQDCTTSTLTSADVWMEAKRSVVQKIFYCPSSDYETVKSWLVERDWAALREYHSTKVWLEFKEMS